MKRIYLSILFLLTGLTAPVAIHAGNELVVKGKVINRTTGTAQPGARITCAGTNNVVMTGNEGTFTLKVNKPGDVLLVEAPGYDNQVVPLRGLSDLCIKLVPAGAHEPAYNSESLKANTGVGISDNNFMKATADVSEQLPYVGSARVTAHSGLDAGGNYTMLRGIKSLNMSSEPLYIVDGIEWQPQDQITSLHEGYFSNPLALLSTDDIASIKVVRNGTAIYGAKAAGGVVIITTKRAASMATEITLNVSMGMKSPFKTIPMMNATDYRIYATDVMRGLTGTAATNLASLKFLNDNATSAGYAATHNNTDWMDQINNTAWTQNYNLGIRGGDQRALYSFSLGYAKNEGNIDQTDFNRLNVRFNSDINLTKKLTARADIYFGQVQRNLFDDGINGYTSPTYLAYIKSPLYHPYQFDNSGNLFNKIADKDELGIGNPLAITDNGEGKTKNYRFTALLQPCYKFSNRFKLTAKAAFTWDKIKESAFTPDFGLAEIEFYNDQGDWYGTGQNMVATMMTRHSNLLLGIEGNYSVLQGSHSLDLTAGYRYQNDTFFSSYGKGYNTGSDKLKSLSVTNSTLRSTGSVHDDWRSAAAYACADYNYLSRYFLNAQIAMESNSNYGRKADGGISLGNVTWALFPSVTAAWVASNEQWLKSMPWINYLKLHATYEVNGNDELPSNAYRTYFKSISYAGLAKGLQLANIGNNKLKWETTRTASAGLDMNLLDNRLTLAADVYVANTSDLLVSKPLSEEYGLRSYYANDGKMRNTGFDISLNAQIIDKSNWKLNGGLSLGHYSNKITQLNSGDFVTTLFGGNVLTAKGHPAGVFYGYKALGVFSTTAEAETANQSIVLDNGQTRKFQAGDMHYQDVDGNGIINDADRQIIGNPNPDVYGNFNFSLQYKHVSLAALFTYSIGNDAYNALRANLENGSNLNNQTTNMKNRWTADGQITSVPRATYGDPMGNAAFSSRWIEDASYLKCKQISLSYDVPLHSKTIRSAQIWAAVSNLFTVTKYLGSDPEFSYGYNVLYQGIDAGLVPSTRSYFIGVRLGL